MANIVLISIRNLINTAFTVPIPTSILVSWVPPESLIKPFL